MSIQPINTPNTAIITAETQPLRYGSSTTWKTYALVVLSYLLISIGVALAFGSIYMATFVHPMLAAATPIVPLTTGIALLPTTSGGPLLSISKAPVYIQGQPLGFHNRDKNGNMTNCWCNAALQGLFHASSYREILEKLDKESTSILKKTWEYWLPFYGIFPLISAFKNYKAEESGSSLPVSTVDSQQIREWLSRGRREVDPSDTQDDPLTLIEELHNRSRQFLPIMQQVDQNQPSPRSENYIDLPYSQEETRSFKQLFESFFSFETDEGQKIKKWFSKAPVGFLIRPLRLQYDLESNSQYVLKGPIDFPGHLELTKEQCKEGSQSYRPDYFVLHHGTSISSGHFTSYIFKEGYWWHINDELVSQVSESEATSKMKQAYIIHYTKS